MIFWTSSLALLLSITIFGFNLIMILAIATSSKLHTIPNILSCNLWMANCIVGIVGIFNNLFLNVNNIDRMLYATLPKNYRTTRSYYFIKNGPTMNISSLFSSLQRHQNLFSKQMSLSKNLSPPLLSPTTFRSSLTPIDSEALSLPEVNSLLDNRFENIPDDNENNDGNNGIDYMTIFGPQTLAALFNSTVSLLVLLSMAFVQIFSRYQTWLPSKAPMRISFCIWSVVIIIVTANFLLVQFTQSFALVIAFQLALISIFLMFNLVLHPLNLFRPQGPQLTTSITQSLWLLLHSLSFTLLAMMLVWEGIQQFGNLSEMNQQSFEGNAQLLMLQLTAYSLHCVGNPMIAILREPDLLNAIIKLCSNKSGTNSRNSSIVINQFEYSPQWNVLPNNWRMIRPPPPPYRSQSCSTTSSNSTDAIVCTGSSISLNGYYTWQNQHLVYGVQENIYQQPFNSEQRATKKFSTQSHNISHTVANSTQNSMHTGENNTQRCIV